jgi:hypothetical protein
MRSSGSFKRDPVLPVVLWAGCYALVLCVLRAGVLAVFSTVEPDAPLLAGSLLRIPGHLLVGALLGAAMFLPRWSHWWAFVLVVPALGANVFAVHYEAILAELPGPEVLGYLPQAPYMIDSIRSQAPPAAAALELAAAAAVLAGAAHLLSRRRFTPLEPGGRAAVGAAALGCVLFVVAAHALPDVVGARLRWASRLPLVWVFMARPARALDAGRAPPTLDEVRRLQRMTGIPAPFADAGPEAPLCGDRPAGPGGPGRDRSVILVVLESVGVEEMRAAPGGAPLLPELGRIARGGFSARRMKAVGTQTCQSLTALYSGQLAQPWDVIHWRRPLPRFGGVARRLAARGYDTAYFHGAGLTFEQKRRFLAMVGFETLFELDSSVDEPTYGWGWADEYTFARFTDWLEGRAEADPDRPVLAVIATLSAHHPYRLPQGWERRFPADGGRRQDFLETLRYTDHHLGRFYDWYLSHEAPRGTYLVVTSDHAPLYENTVAIAEGRPLRFDVPFVVVSPDEREQARWEVLEDRLTSQADVAATVGALAGIAPGRCDQGLDLLGPEWPRGRIVTGVGGRDLNELYLWSGDARGRYLRREDQLEGLDGSGRPARLPAAVRRRFGEFLELFLPVTRYLLSADAYLPGP